MNDDHKMNRWVRSLEKAGLMDKVEDAWYLPDEPVDGSMIRVGGEQEERDESKPDEPSSYAQMIADGLASDTVRSDLSAKIAAHGGRPTELDLETRSDEEPIRVNNPVSTKAPPSPYECVIEELTLAEQTWFTDEDDSYEPVSSPPSELESEADATVDMLEDETQGLITEMQELYDMGNYSGSLNVAELVLQQDPDAPSAKRVRDNSKETLLHMYEAKIGPFDHTPTLAIDSQEVMWRKLDPSTGFVLSRIDGIVNYEDVIDICGLGRFETCRILSKLLQEGIIK